MSAETVAPQKGPIQPQDLCDLAQAVTDVLIHQARIDRDKPNSQVRYYALDARDALECFDGILKRVSCHRLPHGRK